MKKTLILFIRAVAPAIWLATAAGTHASTYWTGTNTAFFHPDGGAADVLTTHVALDRGESGGLYNTNMESGPTLGSPKDTQWAVGTLAEFTNNPSSLSFGNCPLEAGEHPPGDVGKTYVVHLTNEDVYLQLLLTNWGGAGGSGPKTFGYIRSTPAVTAPPATSVTITNPASGAVFAAPANVAIACSATNSAGPVTNVQFFANNTPEGATATAPFSVTANGLAAGAYALTAVATAGGISATSAAVNITVVTPAPIALGSFAATPPRSFQFSYSANVGLRYVVQAASGLEPANWVSLSTNTAASNPVVFVDTNATNSAGYYRVGRLPNP